MQISKRAKGFPVALTMSHWFLIRQIHSWLQSRGATDEATDEALALIPADPFSLEDIQKSQWGRCPLPAPGSALGRAFGDMNVSAGKPNFYGSQTIRVRAAHIPGMIRLLKLVATFAPGGQLGATIWRRAAALERIEALDMLADAAR